MQLIYSYAQPTNQGMIASRSFGRTSLSGMCVVVFKAGFRACWVGLGWVGFVLFIYPFIHPFIHVCMFFLLSSGE